jgi:protein-disulfide isomerase
MKIFIVALLIIGTHPIVTAGQTPIDRSILALPPDTVVAVVDGREITLGEIDEFSRLRDAKKLFQLNQQLFELRERALNMMLGERLLAREAADAGITVDELVARLRVEPIDEREVDAMVEDARRRGAAIGADELRPMIRDYLRDQKRSAARERRIRQLKEEHARAGRPIVWNLQPPRVKVPVSAGDPTKGNGSIEMLQFSDFECPFCQRAQPAIREVLTRYEGKIKMVWKDFPLPIHTHAVGAAVAARCAHEQGKFWQYHDVLFANQQALSAAELRRHAGTVGLDLEQFDACIATGRHQDAIRAELEPDDHPIQVTPTLLINGRMVTGAVGVEQLAAIVEQELER